MNKRIKELAEQVIGFEAKSKSLTFSVSELERLANLVRQDEREACAKLCEIYSLVGNLAGLCATAIRSRGNHEST